MLNEVHGGEVLIFGDLHFSDVFQGKHKDYLQNCYTVLDMIDNLIAERKPSAIVLLGDIIGWSETTIRRRENLSRFCGYLRKWNTYGTVYVVRGNHDLKGYPDFLLMTNLGLLVSSAECGGYFDYYNETNPTVPEVRYHIVDYGKENEPLNIAPTPTYNIVLGHNNYSIPNVTTWYPDFDGVDLPTLHNFESVDMIISGHIHTPSPEFVTTEVQGTESSSNVSLFYLGCPTRPIKDKLPYNVVYGFCANEGLKFDLLPLQLADWNTLFFEDEYVDELSEDEVEDMMRKQNLTDILGKLTKYRMNQTDSFSQIDNIPNATDEAKALAKEYLTKAFNVVRKGE